MLPELKVKKIDSAAKIPKIAYRGDAGLDVFSIETSLIHPGKSKIIRTGIILELPKNTEAQVRPKSGLALKHQVTVLNSPGTIDFQYRGEIKVLLINHGTKPFLVKTGSKIAQIVIQPIFNVKVVESQMVSKTKRGKKGFGSTGIM